MHGTTKISVVVVVRNKVGTLQRCLGSVVEQDYANKEIIVIDGGSTDGTLDVIQSIQQHIDSWESKPDRGIYHAMNKGLDRSTGDWVIFLGADDFLIYPEVLSRAAQRLSSLKSSVPLAYGQVALVDGNGKIIGQWGDFNHQVEGIPHQATFHHRNFFEVHGRFDESFAIAGDYEMLLRELKKQKAEFLSDIIVAAFSWGGVSTNLDNSLAYWLEYARARRQNGLFPYTLGWCKCFAKTLSLCARHRFMRNGNSKQLEESYCRMRAKSPSGLDSGSQEDCILVGSGTE